MIKEELINKGERLYNAIKEVSMNHMPKMSYEGMDENDYRTLVLWYEQVLAFLKQNDKNEEYEDIKRIKYQTPVWGQYAVNKNSVWEIICKLKALV